MQRDVPITFEGDPTAGTLVCRADEGSANLSYVQAVFYQALLFLRRLSFDRPLPWTSVVYDWLRGLGVRIVVSIGTDNAYFAGGAIHFFSDRDYQPPAPPITLSQTPFEGSFTKPAMPTVSCTPATTLPATCELPTSVRSGCSTTC